VQVPSVQYWAMVVFELSGSFHHRKLPPSRDVTVDEPPPPPVSQLAAAAAPVVLDPNKPENQFESGNSGIWETDRSFSGHGIRKIIADLQATGGKAQARELAKDGGGTYPFLGRSWMGPFRPGRYRVAAHLKYVPPVDGSDSLVLQYRVQDTSIGKDIAAMRLFAPGVSGLNQTVRRAKAKSLTLSLTSFAVLLFLVRRKSRSCITLSGCTSLQAL